jgi:hypothetical protein
VDFAYHTELDFIIQLQFVFDHNVMSEDALLKTIVPKAGKQLRACLVCNLIKTPQQFQANGCENCTFLRLNEDPEAIEQCTTTNFDGYTTNLL